MDKALATQLATLRAGQEVGAAGGDCSRERPFQARRDCRDAQRDLGMGHGTKTLSFITSRPRTARRGLDADVLDTIYAGPKAHLRPIHDRSDGGVAGFGDCEFAPKKGYVSLRRKKQFAMIGSTTNSRVDVGLNMKNVPAMARLVAQAPGGRASTRCG